MPSFKQIFKVVNPGDEAQDSATGQADAQERIRSDVENNKVLIYMKGSPETPQCGFSAALVEILSQMEVKFKGIDVLADPDLREAVKQFTQWPTIPQLYVKGEFVGGCDIVREMFEAGELSALLSEKGVHTEAA